MKASVIVASYRSSGTIGRCLDSLRRQETEADYEVLVVDSGGDGTAEAVRSRFPEVRVVSSARRLWPGAARNRGVAAASGSVLAFVDADCYVGRSWLARLIAAHRRRPEPVLGSYLDNGNPGSTVGWAYYFSEFSEWVPERPQGDGADLERSRPDGSGTGRYRAVRDLPANCMSVKRWAFEAYGPFLEEGWCSDTVFNWRVRSAGHDLLLVPGLRVNHVNPTDLGSLLIHRVEHGRTFALRRARERNWSTLRTLAYAAGAPLLPPLLFIRRARRVFGSGVHRGAFVRAAPLTFAGLASWSLGEGLGYLLSLVPRSGSEEG